MLLIPILINKNYIENVVMKENSDNKLENNISDDKASNNTGKAKSSLFSRVLAIIGLLIFLVLFVLFVYFIVSGSEYIIQMLFVIIMYPLILYLISWVKKVFDRKEEK